MQEYYGTFAKEMAQPYWRWRQESYSEVMALRSLQRSARNRIAVGAAALVAGILGASNSTSAVTRTAGSVAMAAGGYVIKSGIDKDSESKIHIEALQELGDSLEASIEPQVIELEDRTVTLSGTVDNQYQQWREILQKIYKVDTGM
jgi:anthranilate phosphoribosyltransferase